MTRPLDDQIRERWNDGQSYTFIADELGCDDDYVRTRVRAMRQAGLDLKLHNQRGSQREHTKPAPLRKYQPKTCKCLRCQGKMISSWPGERVCRKCKDSSTWRGGTLEW